MRAMKRLALVALFALPLAMTGCEKLNDATGPNLSQGPSSARVKVIVEARDTSGVEIGVAATTPPPSDPDGAYDIGFP